MYGVDLDSIQVAVVLSMFKEAPVLDVGLHLATAGKGVHAILAISLFGLSGGVFTNNAKTRSSMHMHFPLTFGSFSLLRSFSVRTKHIICISSFLLLIKAI